MNVNTDTYTKRTYHNSDVPSLVFVDDIGRFLCDSGSLMNVEFSPASIFFPCNSPYFAIRRLLHPTLEIVVSSILGV